MQPSAPTINDPLSARPAAPRVGTAELWAVIAIAAFPLLVKLFCYPSYPGSDDVFVHLHIARNVGEGVGWGMNPHEPLNLSSSPLFTSLLALAAHCGVDLLMAGMFVSAASGFFAVVALHRVLLLLGLGATSRIAGTALAASNIYLWRWNGTAMETTIGLLLLTLAYAAFHRARNETHAGTKSGLSRYLLTGVVAGLAALTRFEIGLVLPCLALARAIDGGRRWFADCAAMAIGATAVLLPWFAFSLSYFDALMPTPFYAKTSSGVLLWNPAVARDLIKLIVSAFGVPLVGLAALGAATWWRGKSSPRHLLVAPLDIWLFVLALAAFYYLKTPSLQSSARYYLPALHLVPVLLACMLHGLLRAGATVALRRAVYIALACHLAVGLVFNQTRVAPVLARYRDEYWRTLEAAAEFLRGYDPATKEGVLVEIDFGTLWYYADDECEFFDGGAVATPDLRGLSVEDKIRRKRPRLVVETLGSSVGAMRRAIPGLQLLWHREFRSHSISRPDAVYVCNIYRTDA